MQNGFSCSTYLSISNLLKSHKSREIPPEIQKSLRNFEGFQKSGKSRTLFWLVIHPSVCTQATLTEINQLQKLQNRAARIIAVISALMPQADLLSKRMGWKNIDELITCESKTMVFKSLNQLTPEYLCGLFTRNSLCSSYSLRKTGTDLRFPKKRSSNGQRCFSYRGAKLWNGLSAESKQATSLYSFKKAI